MINSHFFLGGAGLIAATLAAAFALSDGVGGIVGMAGIGPPQCHGTHKLRGYHDKRALAAARGIKEPWHYELDHYIPLQCGGLDIESNLRFQPWDDAIKKDEDELRLCSAVCEGRMRQADAITELTSKWPPGDIR